MVLTLLKTSPAASEDPGPDLLARLLDAVPSLICVFEPDGHLLLWNDRLNEITEYADGALERLAFRDLVPERYRNSIGGKIERALEEGRVQIDTFLRTADGGEIPFTFSACPIEEGNDVLLCGIGRDVTERNDTRDALRAQREKNRHIFRLAPVGILIADQSGRVRVLNPKGESILGTKPEDLDDEEAGPRWIDPRESRPLSALIRTRNEADEEDVRLRRPDGTEIVCRLTVVPAHLSVRTGKTYFGFFRDCTEMHQVRRKLAESERRFRRLFRRTREAVVLTRPDGPILDCNPAAEELLGYRREELLEMRASELYAEPEERSRRVLPMVLEPGEPSLLEVALRGRDGEEILTSASVSVHRGSDGEVAYLQTHLRDVTDERRDRRKSVGIQERERRRIGRELHDGVAAQLTGMLVMTDRLVEALEDGDSVSATDLKGLRKELRDSLREVRTLSRGLDPLRIRRNGLIGALRQLALEIRTQAEIECRLTENWPSEEPEEETATHLFRITQEALQNVLQHADASRIEVRLRRVDGRRVMEIEDDGRGLEEDYECGEGLGLRTMRDRVALIGARLELSSGEATGRLRGTLVRCRLARE